MSRSPRRTLSNRARESGGRRSWRSFGSNRLAAGLVVGSILVIVVLLRYASPGNDAQPAAGASVERFVHIHGLAIPRWAPDALYVSTHEGLIRFEDEQGWRFVSELPHDFMGFVEHPARDSVFYSSGHPAPGSGLPNPIGFMVSEDGGATWQPLSLQGQADFHAMTVSAADPNVLYAWSGGSAAPFYRSADGGRSWEQSAAEELAASGGVFSLAAHPQSRDSVLAGSPNGLWRSLDGGTSWEQVLAGQPVTAVAALPGNPGHALSYIADGVSGMVLLQGIEGSVAVAENLGLLLPDDDAVFHIAVHPEREQQIYVGTAGGHIYSSADGGESWQQIAEGGETRDPS